VVIHNSPDEGRGPIIRPPLVHVSPSVDEGLRGIQVPIHSSPVERGPSLVSLLGVVDVRPRDEELLHYLGVALLGRVDHRVVGLGVALLGRVVGRVVGLGVALLGRVVGRVVGLGVALLGRVVGLGGQRQQPEPVLLHHLGGPTHSVVGRLVQFNAYRLVPYVHGVLGSALPDRVHQRVGGRVALAPIKQFN